MKERGFPHDYSAVWIPNTAFYNPHMALYDIAGDVHLEMILHSLPSSFIFPCFLAACLMQY